MKLAYIKSMIDEMVTRLGKGVLDFDVYTRQDGNDEEAGRIIIEMLPDPIIIIEEERP